MPTSTPTHAVLYRSTEAASLTGGDLLEIVENAQDANARRKITGLMLHGRMTFVAGVPGMFVQWIEGEKAAVQDLYAAIQDDDRHTNIETLAEGAVHELTGRHRLFPFWSMRMESLANLPSTLPGFLRYVDASQARWKRAA